MFPHRTIGTSLVPLPDQTVLAQGWIVFKGGGPTPTIFESYGVASLTDSGAGDWTVNWTRQFQASKYACAGIHQLVSGVVGQTVQLGQSNLLAAASTRFRCLDRTDVALDPDLVHFIAVGF